MNSHLALVLSCLFLLILQGCAYTCSSETCEACGDGFCDVTGTENCATCPFDCGLCQGCTNTTCGDGFCDASGGETGCNCPSDCACCLDGVCTTLETYQNCPADCVGSLRGIVVNAFNWDPLPGSNVVCGPYGSQQTFNQITNSSAMFLFTNLPPGLYSCIGEYGISLSSTYVFRVYKGSGQVANRTEVIPIELPTGLLSGVTYYQPTGAIFPQVRVVCTNGTTRRETFSDANGVYLFTGVQMGTYSCTGTYPGYSSGVGTVFVPEASAASLNLYLNKLTGGIIGSVLDCTTGLPVQSTVTCVTASGTFVTNTTNGVYYFGNIASGVAVCTARPFDLGYCQNNNTGVVPASLNLTLNIVVFPVPSNLSGYVYDLDTGLALPTADVVCTSSPTNVYATISGSNGLWSLVNITAGDYTCTFRKSGFNSSTLTGIVLTSYQAEQAPNAYLAGLRGCVRISVYNPGYYQGVNSTVRCYDATGKMITDGPTPASGEVFLINVVPGPLTCVLSIPGYLDRTAVIPIPPGDQNVRYDFRTVPNLGTLTGTVTDGNNNPVRGSYVVCINLMSQDSFSGTSDTNGDFGLPNIPVGSYSCRVTTPGYSDQSFTTQVRSAFPSTVAVTLAALPASIVGRVVDSILLSPLAGVQVSCSLTNSTSTSTTLTFTTGLDGLFFFTGLDYFGAWRCTAALPGYQLADPRGFVPVQTSLGTESTLQIPLSPAPGSLVVSVVNSLNQPVTSARLYCGRQNSNKVLVALDQNASATLSEPAGLYSCTANADQLYLPVTTGFVEVQPGATTTLSVVFNLQ